MPLVHGRESRLSKMTDNRPSELQAETYVEYQLLKHDIKISKPSFDQEGADLLIVDQIKRQTTAFLKAQCKYRSYSGDKDNKVSIPTKYVTDNFILFLYVIDEEKNDSLFVYFPEELRHWKVYKDEYWSNISVESLTDQQERIFNNQKADLIKLLLKSIDLKKYTTLIIDGVFLEKAIQKTEMIYQEIWPDKELKRPVLNETIHNLLVYNRFPESKSDVQVMLFLSEDFSLEQWLTFPNLSKINIGLNNIKLSIYKSNKIIAVEILEYLERIVNTENILLVADDIMYEMPLNDLEANGVDVILIRLKGDFGGNLHTKHKWGDINYPLGLAMGLEKFEL